MVKVSDNWTIKEQLSKTSSIFSIWKFSFNFPSFLKTYFDRRFFFRDKFFIVEWNIDFSIQFLFFFISQAFLYAQIIGVNFVSLVFFGFNRFNICLSHVCCILSNIFPVGFWFELNQCIVELHTIQMRKSLFRHHEFR